MKSIFKYFFLIPFLIYFYNYIILTLFGLLDVLGFLPSIALFFSFIPIFFVYIFYIYFLKDRLIKSWLRVLVCLSFYLIPFCIYLGLLIFHMQEDKIQVQLLSKELENSYSVPEVDLDKVRSIDILTLKGLLAGIFISLGGVFMLLEDKFKPRGYKIIQNKFQLKNFFFRLLIMSFSLFILSFLPMGFSHTKSHFVFVYSSLIELSSEVLSYVVSFILSILVLSLFYLFKKRSFSQTLG